eukprot:TRINITY_DN2669_c0_g1_i3.p1 TRINITY_DN2669_c0_g1~~TRINITY_DN2669_c0_g1_i3.p1  ORF type:complete len:170 (-),score=53.23 TRINITY_DN2669_c0_g1_i3:291-800(-)
MGTYVSVASKQDPNSIDLTTTAALAFYTFQTFRLNRMNPRPRRLKKYLLFTAPYFVSLGLMKFPQTREHGYILSGTTSALMALRGWSINRAVHPIDGWWTITNFFNLGNAYTQFCRYYKLPVIPEIIKPDPANNQPKTERAKPLAPWERSALARQAAEKKAAEAASASA